jgi:hypothetical protein
MKIVVVGVTDTVGKEVVKQVDEFGPVQLRPQQPTRAHFHIAQESAFV